MENPDCTICHSKINEPESILKTQCSHIYHRECFSNWHNQQPHCLECQTALDEQGNIAGDGVRTRAQSALLKANQTAPTTSIQQQIQLKTATATTSNTQSLGGNQDGHNQDLQRELLQAEDERIQNVVANVLQAQHVNLLEELESNISDRIEQRVTSTVTNLIRQMSINGGPATRSNRPEEPPDSYWPREASGLGSPLNVSQFNRRIDNLRLATPTPTSEARRIAQLIQSWEIKFNGTSKLSVENFLYRLETQVLDTLNGNFNQLCEHIQSLLTGEAKDWYWTYRKSVTRVTWPSFCEAIKRHFEEHKTDTEIKEAIRSRKQGPNETFDEYRNAIYKMTDKLVISLAEPELVEIMQRGLRPKIRQQLLYVNINSVNQLRQYCLKGESLLNEITKTFTTNNMMSNNRPAPRRNVNEVALEEDLESTEAQLEIDEIKLVCWNCKQTGHKYFDCLENRTIFCYGCGISNVYKPNCLKCNPGNGKSSETFQRKPRKDQN